MTAQPHPLPPAQRTLPGLLRHAAEAFGDRALLQMPGARWTHRDAAPAVARRACQLQAAGVQRGDRVAILCGNRIECLETFLACGWMGAVAVPLNTASMAPQIGYALANSGAMLMVIDAALADRLALVDFAATALRRVWWVDGTPDALPAACRQLAHEAWPATADQAPDPAGATSHAPVATRPGLPPAELAPDDALAILYTSGTTGPAKGVVCPQAQYHWWGVHTAQVLGVTGDDVLCTTLPLFHINALNTFAQALVTGAQVVYLPRFSASGFWAEAAACGATVVYLLGAMVPMLLAQPASAAERAHRVRTGLGPGVPASAAQAFAQRGGVALVEGYGSTETNFVIANRAGPGASPGAMGWLRPGFDARVVDEHDQPLPPGQGGELVLRTDEPCAFASCYFGMAEQTRQAWRNGWFHTGDRVVQQDDGAFRFIDRIKDAIRRRGENISAYEVEQVLQAHPAVATVAVFPVRSDLAEDEVMAAVVPRPGEAVSPADLLAWCQPRLPRFALPRYIELMDDLPRTENGKVQKFKLRERGVGPATWERPSGR